MIVPKKSVLALGTAVAAEDIEVQQNIKPAPMAGSGAALGGQAWKKVRGELLVFDDPEERLPILDAFEEYHPGGPSTYLRALVSINLSDGRQTTAWTYIGDPATLEEFDGDIRV